jgi:hypothetical protein
MDRHSIDEPVEIGQPSHGGVIDRGGGEQLGVGVEGLRYIDELAERLLDLDVLPIDEFCSHQQLFGIGFARARFHPEGVVTWDVLSPATLYPVLGDRDTRRYFPLILGSDSGLDDII